MFILYRICQKGGQQNIYETETEIQNTKHKPILYPKCHKNQKGWATEYSENQN